MKKVIKNILVVAGWFILGILGLLLLASLLLQTRPIKNKIADVAENQAEKFLEGDFSIGKIDGNFFTGLVIEDLLVMYEQDTLIYIAEVNASYNLWSLVGGEIDVPNASIVRPYIFVKQYNDSTWNFQRIIKPTLGETDTTTQSGGMALSFADFSIEEGRIETEALDTVFPSEMNRLNTQLAFQMDGSELNVELNEFNFSTANPDFTLNQLEFVFRQNSNFYELSNFRLITAMNRLNADAELQTETPKEGTAQINSGTLQLQEFEYFLPDLKIPAKPTIQIDARMQADSVFLVLQLADEEQEITLDAQSSNLISFLSKTSDEQLGFNVQGEFSNINVGHWIGNPDFNYTINGNVSADGRGIDPANAEFLIKADLGESVVEDRRFNELVVDLEMVRGNLNGMVRGNGEFGEFRVEPDIQNLLEAPVYELELETRSLNLAQLLQNDSLSSNINLTAYVSGESFKPEEISATAEIRASASRFQAIEIDTLFTLAEYGNENLMVDTLRVQAQSALVTANGNYNFNGPSDVRLNAEFSGMEAFQPYFSVPELETSGDLNAQLTGTTDSLTLNASLNLDSTSYGEMTLQDLQLDADGHIAGNDTLFNAQLSALNFVSGSFLIDSVSAQVNGNPDSLYVNTSISNSDLSTQLATGFVPGETMRFQVDEWQIQYKNQQLELQQPSRIRIDSTTYQIENFRLASSDNDSAQFIAIDGMITRHSTEDFTLEVRNIDIGKLSETLENDFNATGILDFTMSIEGTAQAPIVTGNLNIDGARMNEFSFTNLNGIVDYADNQFNFESLLDLENNGRIDISATLPLQLNLDTMGYYFDSSAPITGQAVVDSFSIAALEELEAEFDAGGILNVNLNVTGTAEAPEIEGKFEIDGAEIDDYSFSDFYGGLDYQNEEIHLEALIVPEISGKFDVSATLPLQLNLDTMGYYISPEAPINGRVEIDSFSIAVLEALDLGSDITGFIQGNIDIGGTITEPNPNGRIRLIDASLLVAEYGIDYQTIELSLELLKNTIQLDTLNVISDDGILKGSGSIGFATDFYSSDVSRSQIEFNFDQFNLLDHNQFNMQVTGHASLGGEKGNVVYGGDLSIPQAEINLPAVLGMLGRMSTAEMPKPILVRHAESMGAPLDSLGIQTFEIVQRDSVNFDYLDNFEGQLRLRIPGNTWIKNEDMRIEISGELELIKNQEFFELFGNIDVVRGQYDLLGKTFVISEGSIGLQGGEELVPRLDIEAVYSFRNPERVVQEITVQISGTTQSPQIEFLLDGNSISEGDALSYILFGKSMNALTMSEQQNVESAGGRSIAERAAASLISSQLTNFLGDKLNVDFIEVKSEGGFENASVVVGKYITNDLFVSYEQRFGEVDEKDLAKYEVMLEYELFRFLFFELNNSSTDSGFDVIVKFDVK